MAMEASVPRKLAAAIADMVDTAEDNDIRDALRTLAHPAWLPHVISYVAQQAALAVPTFTLSATRSTGVKLPLPIRAFVESIVQMASIPVTTMLVSLVYMKRLRSHPLLRTQKLLLGAHSMVLTSLILSDKYCDDNARFNSRWAKFVNLPTVAINNLERQMLFLLSWDLHLNVADIHAAMEPLLNSHLGMQRPMGIGNAGLSRRATAGKQIVACSVCMNLFTVPCVYPTELFEPWSSTTWPDYLDACPLCRSYFSYDSLQETHE